MLTHPRARTAQIDGEDELQNIPEGMFILRDLPKLELIKPMGYVKGSRKQLEKISAKMIKDYATAPAVVEEWNNFTDNITPKNDNVIEYLATHQLHIPFRNLLFPENEVDCITPVGPVSSGPKINSTNIEKSETLPSVKWSNRDMNEVPINSPRTCNLPGYAEGAAVERIVQDGRLVAKKNVSKTTRRTKRTSSVKTQSSCSTKQKGSTKNSRINDSDQSSSSESSSSESSGEETSYSSTLKRNNSQRPKLNNNTVTKTVVNSDSSLTSSRSIINSINQHSLASETPSLPQSSGIYWGMESITSGGATITSSARQSKLEASKKIR